MTHTFLCERNTAVVQTSQGIVKGYVYDGVTIFKGIPYARAKRFHAPEPVAPWKGIFDATSYGFVCPLLTIDRPKGELFVSHRFWPMDEDCLNLNIWSPAVDGGKRPVLVWLHGGGYYAGSSIEHVAYDGANMSRFGNAVVVSINHRLNILGYFDLSDYGDEYANSGNAGGDDIIAALQWVRDNIANFGGDPDNVTVFGQSGGGAKVTTLLQTPAADGLYRRGIIMSGVIGPGLADSVGSGRKTAEAVMAELGIKRVKDLETVDYYQLAKAYQKVEPELKARGENVGCTPHPNDFYLGEPTVNGFREETKNVPLLVGSVFSEFMSFLPMPCDRIGMNEEEQIAAVRSILGKNGADTLIPLFQAAYPERPVADILRLDFTFRGPEIDFIAKRSALNPCTWSYLFNQDQPICGSTPPWHCCDIPFVFHNVDLVMYPHGQLHGESSKRLEEQIFSTVMSFARTGNPNHPGIPYWPASRQDAEQTLILGGDAKVRTNFDHELIREQMRYMGPVFDRIKAKDGEDFPH